MDFAKDDAFETASRCLERLAQIKEKKLIEDMEYQELRNLLISELKRCASSRETITTQEKKIAEHLQVPPVPYGQLHSEIVQKIESTSKTPGDAKQGVFRAMSEMAENQALYPGDVALLTELVDKVFTPLSGDLNEDKGEVSRKLLEIQRSLIEISAKIRDGISASPAAKAIADTSLQSSARATAELPVELTKVPATSKMSLSDFWGKYVLTDVKGAFEGGSAAVGIAQAFAAASPIALTIAAAMGVVVGAGIASGIAYADRGKQN